MRYLLLILLIAAVSCSKKDNDQRYSYTCKMAYYKNGTKVPDSDSGIRFEGTRSEMQAFEQKTYNKYTKDSLLIQGSCLDEMPL